MGPWHEKHLFSSARAPSAMRDRRHWGREWVENGLNKIIHQKREMDKVDLRFYYDYSARKVVFFFPFVIIYIVKNSMTLLKKAIYLICMIDGINVRSRVGPEEERETMLRLSCVQFSLHVWK